MNQVYIDATVQFSPVHPTAQVKTCTFWHLLAPRCGKNRNISKMEAAMFIVSVLYVVCTKSDTICLSSVELLISLFSPVSEVQFSEPSDKQNREVLPPKKRPQKGETQDLICQSSKGTQSERWIWLVHSNSVCFTSTLSSLLQAWESARTCETVSCVCV